MQKRPILIFGSGFLGQEVAEQLRHDAESLMVVGDNYSEMGEARARGFDANVVNIMDDTALQALGIGSWVRLIFCLFPEESKNVFLTIAARALDPVLDIVCISDSAESGAKLLGAGASKVIDPYAMSAVKIHELTRRPWLVETLEATLFSREQLDLAEVELSAGSILAGERVGAVELSGHYDLILLGSVDSAQQKVLQLRNRRLDHRLKPGDLLVVIGHRDEIQRFKADIASDSLDPGVVHRLDD